MEFATYVKKISDALYPGLHRDIITKNYRFNQYNSDFYLLIEVGYNVNDIKETQNTVPYIVDILDIALNNMLISDISEYR